MTKFVRQGNEQFNPRLYNNQINSAGMKSACQSLGPQAKMSGGSQPTGKDTYGVKDVNSNDAQLFAGSYAPVKVSKLNQCGAGKKRRKVSKKKKTTKKRRTYKKKTTKKRRRVSKKKKTTKKKKVTKKKTPKSKTVKRKSLVTKFRNAFGMKGGNSQGHHAGYTPVFKGIAPYNSALANPQSIKSVDSCSAPNSYNHYTRVSK